MLLYYVFFGPPNKARRVKMGAIKRVFFGLRRSFWQKSKGYVPKGGGEYE